MRSPHHLLPLLLLLGPGCPKESTGNDDTGLDTGETDTEQDDTGEDTDDWPSGEPTLSWTDDLASGAPVDLDWDDQSSVACWPGTEDANFNGSHVFFEVTQAADIDLYLRVTPEPGVDVSLYAMEFDGSIQTPPDVSDCLSCEASADWTDDSNPGGTEEVYLSGYNPYQVLIAVAGANHADTGGFTLELWAVENPW
jgi:hypothetical protein